MSDTDVLRRIADRGLSLAHAEAPQFVDLFQHMLDEIARCDILPKITMESQDMTKLDKVLGDVLVENELGDDAQVRWNRWFLANVQDTEDFRWVALRNSTDIIERLQAKLQKISDITHDWKGQTWRK